MYLQMTQDGRVSGSDAQTLYSVLELKSVRPGHVVIKGRSTSLFLCMDSGGQLRGQRQYEEADCTFRELLLADGYTRLLSSHYGFPVSLVSKHSPHRNSLPFTRFLPITNTLTRVSVSDQPPNNQKYFNMDSDDLLGMGLNSMSSPHFSMDK
ncbi:fibroblast growth factor 21 [Scomber japonicus]|uniref:fibroblast growth factor 21 n=1 Tax=Scomber japonicus TaxID=13676 RepID=UPI0023065E86|nr:fibroblast growth factor 21 [Scomber japonicus]